MKRVGGHQAFGCIISLQAQSILGRGDPLDRRARHSSFVIPDLKIEVVVPSADGGYHGDEGVSVSKSWPVGDAAMTQDVCVSACYSVVCGNPVG